MSSTLVDIGSLITTRPDVQSGRPIIAGTATSVRIIAAMYKKGDTADDIAADRDHLSLAQVYAALAYYHANREAVDQDLAEEDALYERLAAQLRLKS